jgi:hypothetical protein
LVRATWAFIGLVCLFPADARGQIQRDQSFENARCTPASMANGTHDGLILWEGRAEDFTLQNLAARSAPCIWMSPDEPTEGPRAWPTVTDLNDLPRLRSRVHSDNPTVYFNVREMRFKRSLTAEARALAPEIDHAWSAERLDALFTLRLRYFFYYLEEAGIGQHTNDLESAELKIEIGHDLNTGTFFAKLVRGEAAAHGLGWYTNTVDFTKFYFSGPYRPTVLVEEGKHASAFDVNQDGVFSPGFDANVGHEEAWGIRDSIAYTHTLAPTFRSEYFKRRELPPTPVKAEHVRASSVDPTICGSTSPRFDRQFDETRRTLLETNPKGGLQRHMLDHWKSAQQLFSEKKFCDATHIDTPHGGFFAAFVRFGKLIQFGGARNGYSSWRERIPLGLRFDQGWGWTAGIPVGYNVPYFGGWAIFRMNGPFPRRMTHYQRLDSNLKNSYEVLYTSSATSFVSLYGLGGAEEKYSDPPEGKLREDQRGLQPVWEGGLRFRVPLPGTGWFLGTRIGYRFNGGIGSAISNSRLVIDCGGAAW